MKKTFTKQEIIKALKKWQEIYLSAEIRALERKDLEDARQWIGRQVTLESVAKEFGYDLEKRREIEEQ